MNKQLLATLIKRAGFSTTYELERLEHFANIVVLECCKVVDNHYEPVYEGKVVKRTYKWISDEPQIIDTDYK